MSDFVIGLFSDGFAPVFLTLLEFMPTVIVVLAIVTLFENMGWVNGFACGTLALSSIDDRRTARFVTFLPCMAKLPVLMFLCGIVLGSSFFAPIFFYVLAVFVGILASRNMGAKCPRFKKTNLKCYCATLSISILNFLYRITVGLLIAVSVVYALQYFGWIVPIAEVFVPFFRPIGLDNVALVVALLFGLVGKEMIIGVLLSFGIGSIGFTTASAISFIVFLLLYTPCLPSLAVIKSKFGWGFAVRTAVFNFSVAYILSFVAFMLAVFIGL